VDISKSLVNIGTQKSRSNLVRCNICMNAEWNVLSAFQSLLCRVGHGLLAATEDGN